MSDNKKVNTQENIPSSGSDETKDMNVIPSNNNDIPYVPPTDRTNLTRIDPDYLSMINISSRIDNDE